MRPEVGEEGRAIGHRDIDAMARFGGMAGAGDHDQDAADPRLDHAAEGHCREIGLADLLQAGAGRDREPDGDGGEGPAAQAGRMVASCATECQDIQ
jgi:hypothetical protein